MTSKFSRNLSFSSRCHWKVRFAGVDDQRPLDEPADLQLLEQQARHDRLAGARVVGQQEADARQLDEVVVDRFELVRQRVDAGDREREVRIVLVGQPETQSLDSRAEIGTRRRRTALFAAWLASCASCSALRIGSWTLPVVSPLPMSLTELPIGTTTRTSTGSGKIAPRTITFGRKDSVSM